MSSKEQFFQVVGHIERRDFCNFLPVFKCNLLPEDDVQRKNNGTLVACDFPLNFKNLIGFCVAPSQMVELELDFWGCKNQKMGDGLNFGALLAGEKRDSENLRQPLTYSHSNMVQSVRQKGPTRFRLRRDICQLLSPLEKGQFRWIF